MKKTGLFGLFILIPLFSLAQWVDNPAENTMVAGSGNDQTFPKMATTQDGNFFISSWKAVPDTTKYYQMWLQFVNHEGVSQWGIDGIQISNQPCRSWLSDYDLIVDQDGNAILAMEDMRGGNGFSHVAVYAIAPDGNAVWDTNGIQLTNDLFMAYSPTLCLTNSQNILVAWDVATNDKDTNSGIFIKIQKLSPAGVPLWPEPISVTGPDTNYLFPNLLPVGEDDFMLVWQKLFSLGTGYGQEWYKYIYAMRFDEDGTPRWPENARICDHGDSAYVVPMFLKLFPLQDAGEGVYVAWFDDRYKTDFSNIYVQQVDTSGNLKWPINGVAVSPTNVGYDRVDPRIVMGPSSQDLFVFWEEYRSVGIYDSFGVLGQKIKPDGSTGWGDLGKSITEFTLDTVWYIEGLRSCQNNKFLLLLEQEYDSIVGPDTLLFDQLFATQLDTAGVQTWTTPTVLMAATNGTKFYPVLSDLSQDIFVAAWAENRDEQFDPDGMIFAQNITLNGTLGPLGIPDYNSNDQQLILFPNPTSSSSWVQFRQPVSGKIEIEVYNAFGQLVMSANTIHRSADRTTVLNASHIPSGIYLVRVNYEEKEQVLRWVVLK